MKTEMKGTDFPQTVQEYLRGKMLVEITENHKSGDRVYRVDSDYILKISENMERLGRERTANDYLTGKLPVSQTVLYTEEEGKAYYLKTMLRGDTLAEKVNLSEPQKLVRFLAEAMHMFHSVDVGSCPIKCPDSEGDCMVHGDFCLPNILVCDGRIAGFIDTEAAGVGDPWMDYAWCIWSLEYNLGTDRYTPMLLEALGIEFDRDKYESYTR